MLSSRSGLTFSPRLEGGDPVQGQDLPAELWIRILTHPILLDPSYPGCSVSSVSITALSTSRLCRRQTYRAVSLTCHLFRDILADPFVRAMWTLTYHGGSVRDTLFFVISRGWTRSLEWILTGSLWLNHLHVSPTWPSLRGSVSKATDPDHPGQGLDHEAYRQQTTLNDTLVYAVCHQSRLLQSDGAWSMTAGKPVRSTRSAANCHHRAPSHPQLPRQASVTNPFYHEPILSHKSNGATQGMDSVLDWYWESGCASDAADSTAPSATQRDLQWTVSDGEEPCFLTRQRLQINDILDTYYDTVEASTSSFMERRLMKRYPRCLGQRSSPPLPGFLEHGPPESYALPSPRDDLALHLTSPSSEGPIQQTTLVVDMVRMLLQRGADPHVMDDFPLRRAARNGSLDLVDLLIRYGASPTAKNNDAIKFAAQHGHRATVQKLMDHGASAMEALKWACSKAQPDLVHWLLHEPTDSPPFLAWRLETREWCLENWLERTFESHDRSAADRMRTMPPNGALRTGASFVTAWQIQQQSLHHPLILSARQNESTSLGWVLKFMFGHESSARHKIVQCQASREAMLAAVRFSSRAGYIASVRLLLHWGGSVMTALHYASKFAQLDIVSMLLQDYRPSLGLDDDPLRAEGRRCLTNAIRSTSDPQLVEMILEKTQLDRRHVRDMFLSSPLAYTCTAPTTAAAPRSWMASRTKGRPEPVHLDDHIYEWIATNNWSLEREWEEGSRHVAAVLRALNHPESASESEYERVRRSIRSARHRVPNPVSHSSHNHHV